MKCLRTVALVVVMMTLFASVSSSAERDICWKDSYGRGVGTIPTACPAGTEKDPTGLLCYPACKAGYKGVGPVCWQSCPSSFTDTGGHCLKPGPYGRGAGYPWKFGDSLNDSSMFQRCEKDHGRGNCEKNGAIVYPKCKAGFHNVGCCTCSPDCPPGTTDIGVSCQKDSYGRGVGDIKVCEAGLVNDAGLCYQSCRAGTTGVGPVCWHGCPSDFPVNCGASCAKSSDACAMSIVKQVQSTGELALNVGLLVSTGGAGSAALKAAQTTARQTGKTVLSQAARQSAKQAFKTKLRQSATRQRVKNAKEAYDAVNDIANSPQNEQALDNLAEAFVSAKEKGEFDTDVLFAMEDADPTGVLAVVNAFNKPICGTPQASSGVGFRAPAIPVPTSPQPQPQPRPQPIPPQQYGGQSGNTCRDLVQGRIAYDYNNNRTWADANLNRLCQGASDPTQPPRCFQRVMFGGISWGGGTQWQWQNALDLCGGTDNADQTVACFQREVSRGWQAAIQTCRKR